MGAERPKARARNLGQSFVIGIGDDIEQFLDAIAPDRRDDAKLGKMGADRVDYRSLLANEEMAYGGASGSSAALAFWPRRTASSAA